MAGFQDRRSKFRQVKQAARLTKEKGVPLADVALMAFWVLFFFYLLGNHLAK